MVSSCVGERLPADYDDSCPMRRNLVRDERACAVLLRSNAGRGDDKERSGIADIRGRCRLHTVPASWDRQAHSVCTDDVAPKSCRRANAGHRGDGANDKRGGRSAFTSGAKERPHAQWLPTSWSYTLEHRPRVHHRDCLPNPYAQACAHTLDQSHQLFSLN
jgi:hypothetical protein